jgi:hypothetical protein
VRRERGDLSIPKSVSLTVDLLDSSLGRRATALIKQTFSTRNGIRCTAPSNKPRSGDFRLLVAAAPKHPSEQYYRLEIRPGLIRIAIVGEASLRASLATLMQLFTSPSRRITAMTIEDWPDFPVRGVMLDVSRDKVPTTSELLRLIDLFADWKINQLQLYMEHVFAYRGHKEVWRDASPFTPAEIRRIDARCRRLGIELVPNQNSFGHMERWLRHARYAPLAETDKPWKTPWGTTRNDPTTLCPADPRSIRLVADLYDQLLPNFTSRLLNVGCDETWELGQGRSREACARRGKGRVYLDYLLKVHREVRRRDHRMMFWSDIIMEHPSLIRRLPRDSVVLIWGYEADHPFADQCRKVSSTGLEFYVCPGTSSWCSFAGRTRNSRENLREAAVQGAAFGATGYLITDWGDYGHRQFTPASYGSLLYGAGLAWCRASNDKVDVSADVDRRVLADPACGLADLWARAGDVYLATGVTLKNRTVLFGIMEKKFEEVHSIDRLTVAGLRKALSHVTSIERASKRIKCKSAESKSAMAELKLTLRVLAHACRRGLFALNQKKKSLSGKLAAELAKDMRKIITEHRRLWLVRNRPGGLQSSLGYYQDLLNEYERLGEKTRPISSTRRRPAAARQSRPARS